MGIGISLRKLVDHDLSRVGVFGNRIICGSREQCSVSRNIYRRQAGDLISVNIRACIQEQRYECLVSEVDRIDTVVVSQDGTCAVNLSDHIGLALKPLPVTVIKSSRH